MGEKAGVEGPPQGLGAGVSGAHADDVGAPPEELQREYPLPSAFAAYFPKGAKLGKTGGRR